MMVSAEVFRPPCSNPGETKVFEQKTQLLCDQSGRRVNLNALCRKQFESSSGRLILDDQDEAVAAEPKKQAGHFPELCLPGSIIKVTNAPWTCTCAKVPGSQQASFQCVVSEDGAGRGMGGQAVNSIGRRKRSAPAPTPEQHRNAEAEDVAPARAVMGMGSSPSSPSPSPSVEPDTQAMMEDAEPAAGQHNGTLANAASFGRYENYNRPNVVIEFCDEFGYPHTLSTSPGAQYCSCDSDETTGKLKSTRKRVDELYNNYWDILPECLPGTYTIGCLICDSDHICRTKPCPPLSLDS